jgi:hypothetical protein
MHRRRRHREGSLFAVKQGDRYLRRLLVVGATAVIRHNRGKQTPGAQWLRSLLEKKPVRLVSVALANKTARIAWALLARGQRSAHIGSAPADGRQPLQANTGIGDARA